jgi:hypothetical protein
VAIAELEDLEHTLDIALKAAYLGIPGELKAANLRLLSRMRNKFDALDALGINSFEATAEHRAEGQSSVVGWLKHHCRESQRGASRRRRLARRLKAMPFAMDAMERGRITFEHVTVLAVARARVGEDGFALAEEALVDAAEGLRYSDFERTVEYFVQRADPDREVDEEERAFAERRASSSSLLDGRGRVDADFDKAGFQLWQAELDRVMDHLYEQDCAEAKDRLGRRPLPSELARTAGQRRLDAMVLMAERSAAFGDRELGPSRFQLVVHGDTDTVAQLTAAVLEALNDENPGAELTLADVELSEDSLHELADGTVVTVNTVLLALLTGTIRGILYDPQGEILRYGHGRRLFSDAQAQAALAKYRRCCHAWGCDRTGRRLQTDHTREHEDGGPTDIDNATPHCGPDNRFKHNTKGRPPPETDTAHDTGQRRLPPRLGPR